MSNNNYQSILWEELCRSELSCHEDAILNTLLRMPHPAREREFVQWAILPTAQEAEYALKRSAFKLLSYNARTMK